MPLRKKASKKTQSKKKVSKKKVNKKTASKKSSPKKKTSKGTGMALFSKELAEAAQAGIAKETFNEGGTAIKFNEGEFEFKDESMGDELELVVVDELHEHAYYPEAYDKDNIQTPVCFSIGDDEGEMGPHEDSEEPQSDSCAKCWANGFGSADTGRGKACRQSRRLSVIDVDALSEAEDVVEIPLTTIKLPPTNIKAFKKFKKHIAKAFELPLFALTSLFKVIRVDNYYNLEFEECEPIEDMDLVQGIKAHAEENRETLGRPFEKFEGEDEKPKGKRQKVSKKKTQSKKKVNKKTSSKKKSKKKTRRKF